MCQRGVAMHRARHIEDVLHIAEVDTTSWHDADFVAIAQLHFSYHRYTLQSRRFATRGQNLVETEFNQFLDCFERLHAGINGAVEGKLQPLACLH